MNRILLRAWRGSERFPGTFTHVGKKGSIFFKKNAVFVDTSDDAPSQRDLTCASASLTTKGR